MANITCAWELGGGLGHIYSLSTLGNELKSAGHKVAYILKEIQHSNYYIEPETNIYQAPRAEISGCRLPMPILNYTEILMHRGYFSQDILFELCRRWRNLLIQSETELLIVDHSPTAILAAHTLGIKCISLGTGFASPERVSPFPIFRETGSKYAGRIHTIEQGVLSSMNSVLKKFQIAPFTNLHDLFSTLQCDLLTTFKELDIYQGRAQSQYIGPLLKRSEDDGETDIWPHTHEQNVFVYLKKEYKQLNVILSELSEIKANFVIYIDGVNLNQESSISQKNIVFLDKPANPGTIFKIADLILCHAGHGVVSESLLNGTPLILLPMVLEQGLTAGRVEGIKAGRCIKFSRNKTSSLKRDIEKILHEDSYKTSANNFFEKYKTYSREKAISGVIEKCEFALSDQKSNDLNINNNGNGGLAIACDNLSGRNQQQTGKAQAQHIESPSAAACAHAGYSCP